MDNFGAGGVRGDGTRDFFPNPDPYSQSQSYIMSGPHCSDLVDEFVQVGLGWPTRQRRFDGLVLPLLCAPAHLPALVTVHGLPYDRCQLVTPHLAADLHPDAPFGALVASVGLLLSEEGPAEHCHPGAARGVSSGVRQENTHGLVRQNLLLRAPRHELGAALDGGHKELGMEAPPVPISFQIEKLQPRRVTGDGDAHVNNFGEGIGVLRAPISFSRDGGAALPVTELAAAVAASFPSLRFDTYPLRRGLWACARRAPAAAAMAGLH
ncbi:hypothetical protein EJB05_37068, partial [Eragrostis curvula]